MGLHVVDRNQWQVVGQGDAAGGGRPHQQRAGQAGARRVGHGIQRRRPQAGLGAGRFEQPRHARQMVTGSEFGDDATIGGVQVGLGVQYMRAEAAIIDGDGGLVAGGFNREYRSHPRMLAGRWLPPWSFALRRCPAYNAAPFSGGPDRQCEIIAYAQRPRS